MKPWKTGLFIAYCLASMILLGHSFSHTWRAKKAAAEAELKAFSGELRLTTPDTPDAPTP